MNQIKLIQKPIIEHELALVGASIEKRLKDLNLDNLVATTETVKSLKETRAALNKKHAELNDQLKEVLSPITDPVDEIKTLFKQNVTEKFKPADDLLKTKISSVEMKIKEEKEKKIRAYFQELCISEEISFLKFEDLNLEMKLSVTEKKYKEKCNEFVSKVVEELSLIDTQEYSVEILVEYKKTLNVAKSIADVKERKQKEAEEKERVKQAEYLKRAKRITAIGMKPDKETGTYVYNDFIYLTWDNVKDLEELEFSNKIIEFEEKIKEDWIEKAKQEPIKEPEVKKEPVQQEIPVTAPPAKPLKAPKVQEELEILSASFEVRGTLPQIKALAAYMRVNAITFKKINNE